GLARVELALLGGVLLLGGRARRGGRAQARLGGAHLLDGVAHVDLYQLLQLLALRAYALLVDERAAQLRLGGRVAEGQVERDPDAEVLEAVRAEVRERLRLAADEHVRQGLRRRRRDRLELLSGQEALVDDAD